MSTLTADIEPTVILPKSVYEALIEDRAFLEALRSAGVDNWCGYDYAIDIYNGNE